MVLQDTAAKLPAEQTHNEQFPRKPFTFDRAMKERTATAVNMMVGISMTTAEPTLVLKKVMVASQPLPEETQQG